MKAKRVYLNKKTETSGSARGELTTLFPGMYIGYTNTANWNNVRCYLCINRVVQRGRGGDTLLTLMSSDGQKLTVSKKEKHLARRPSIQEILAYKAATTAPAEEKKKSTPKISALKTGQYCTLHGQTYRVQGRYTQPKRFVCFFLKTATGEEKQILLEDARLQGLRLATSEEVSKFHAEAASSVT